MSLFKRWLIGDLSLIDSELIYQIGFQLNNYPQTKVPDLINLKLSNLQKKLLKISFFSFVCVIWNQLIQSGTENLRLVRTWPIFLIKFPVHRKDFSTTSNFKSLILVALVCEFWQDNYIIIDMAIQWKFSQFLNMISI